MASNAAAITTDAGGVPSTPSATIPNAGAGIAGASPAPNSSASGSLPDAAGNENIRQLREAYENLKREHEPYSKLGRADEISTHVSMAQRITNNAVQVGTELGYPEQEIRDAMAGDPEGTILFLRQKQAEAAQNQDPIKRVEQLLDKRFKPLEEKFHQKEESEALEKAHTLFTNAFGDGIKTLFKDEQVPEKEQDILYEATLLLLRRDGEAVTRLREGKTSDVTKYLTEARSLLDGYYLSRTQRENERVGGPKPGTTPGAKETKFTLDDLAEGKFPKTGPLAKYA